MRAFENHRITIAMASDKNATGATITDTEEMKALYLQVDASRTSLGTLGLSAATAWTVADFRIAYRALALRLHPDKCPPSQAELHTRLFAKVQNAYEDLCTKGQHDREAVEERQSEFSAPRPSDSAPKVHIQKHKQQPVPDILDAGPSKGRPSQTRNHKTKRDQRHAGKAMKAEEAYQKAWQEERERRWKRERQSKLSQAGAGNKLAVSK